ncbi:hypothetical protein N7478_008071 [Penicillium angulare]|uniref:uncharacterized protein n=1 Tax=Penicillium angulare TaxID=116970 RepID=UPI00254186BE|nr:uncharacterized protein N7478_008071 [Penicillium angulare]KAJ5272946.1 hypothetical protein N7478_008071 [Penicillium angulare]
MASFNPNKPETNTSSAPIAYRLTGLETWNPKAKSDTMSSIADDIRATFMCIAQHMEAGKLTHNQTQSIDTVIETIRGTEVANRRALERRTQRLRREKEHVKREYRVLVREAEKLGLAYQAKVQELMGLNRGLMVETGELRAEKEMLRLRLEAKKREIVGNEVDGVKVKVIVDVDLEVDDVDEEMV